MPFPQRLLYDDETVALDLRPHWWYFSRHILTAVPLLLLVVGVASIQSDDLRNVVRWPVAALVLLWAAWLGNGYLRWRRTSFVVTDQRVLYRAGMLGRRGVEIPLEEIANIRCHQGIWERVVGAGDLDVESAGEGGDAVFRDVRHPDGVQHEIYHQLDELVHRDARAGADEIGEAVVRAMQDRGGSPAAADDVADKVEQLARLRDQGHISPDEFERRKTRLLDEL
jgi:uncharacterized membrane protein YdbT with pleckstrin-like domain